MSIPLKKHPGLGQEGRMINLPEPDAAERIADFLAEHMSWSAFWDKRECLWRLAGTTLPPACRTGSPDSDAVIVYRAAHS